jgi:DNA invertase Pin-like site-specific DNA recombinase
MIRKITTNTPAGQRIGYARVSTDGQDFAAQVEKLKADGCAKIFAEKQSGSKRDREQLAAALEYVREGDTFVCVKADRIARSTKDFLDTIDRLDAKGVKLQVLNYQARVLQPICCAPSSLPFHSSSFHSFAIG